MLSSSLSAYGSTVVWKTGYDIQAWTTDTCKQINSFKNPGTAPVALSPNGKRIAFIESDSRLRILAIRKDIKSAVTTAEIPISGEALKFSSDGELLIGFFNDFTIRILAAQKNRWIRSKRISMEYDGLSFGNISISQKGMCRTTLCRGYGIEAFSFGIEAIRRIFNEFLERKVEFGKNADILLKEPKGINCFDINPTLSFDGRYLAVDEENRIVIYSMDKEQIHTILSGHIGKITSVDFSKDGLLIASGSSDKTIMLWDVKSGRRISTFKGHSDIVNSVAISNDNTILASASLDKTIILWSIETGKQLRSIHFDHSFPYDLEFSRDDELLVAVMIDNSIEILRVATGELVHAIRGHVPMTSTFQSDTEGRILFTSGWDGEIRAWDIQTGNQVAAIVMYPFDETEEDEWNEEQNWLVYTPEGYFDCSEKTKQFISWRVGNVIYDADEFFHEYYRPGLLKSLLYGDNK